MSQFLSNQVQRGRRKWRQVKARAAIRNKPKPMMLHVGCGQIFFDGWVHLDADESLKHSDAIWYSDDGLPCQDRTCRFIYSEHFLEHLTVQQGLYFLRECKRALVPGGVLRIAMPDMKECVRQYWEGDWKQQPWLEKYGYNWIQTGCEMVNICFREWEHKWLYDSQELERRMREAGFQIVKPANWRESEHAELCEREIRVESALIFEATVADEL